MAVAIAVVLAAAAVVVAAATFLAGEEAWDQVLDDVGLGGDSGQPVDALPVFDMLCALSGFESLQSAHRLDLGELRA